MNAPRCQVSLGGDQQPQEVRTGIADRDARVGGDVNHDYDGRSHKRNLYVYGIRYTPGSDLARRFPGLPRGWFKTHEEAESVRAACPNAERMEVVDVREVST